MWKTKTDTERCFSDLGAVVCSSLNNNNVSSSVFFLFVVIEKGTRWTREDVCMMYKQWVQQKWGEFNSDGLVLFFSPLTNKTMHKKECVLFIHYQEEVLAGAVLQRHEKNNLSQFNLKLQHFCVSNNPFSSCHHSYSPFSILLKVTLGVVV